MSARQAGRSRRALDPWDQIDLSGSLSDALRRLTSEVERRKIDRAMKDTGGNKMQAADALQVGLKVLVAKMRQVRDSRVAAVAARFPQPARRAPRRRPGAAQSRGPAASWPTGSCPPSTRRRAGPAC